MKGKDLLWMIAATTTFVLGVGTGVLISKGWMEEKYKRQYKKIADDEIESVKREFAKKKPSPPKSKESDDGHGNVVDFPFPVGAAKQYRDTVSESGYSGDAADGPHVISPEEFGDMDEYECLSLTYFSDGILADENNQIIADPDNLIGPHSLEQFGEYEEDSVFVRNDKIRCDFEILLDLRTYDQAIVFMPPM